MKLPALALSGVLVSSLLSVAITTPAEASSHPILVWTATSYDNVFADDLPSADATQTIDLTSARNEYEAAQIAVRSTTDLAVSGVDFSNLTSDSGSIAAANLSYNFVEFEHLKANSIFAGSQPVSNPIRPAPGNFPDALSNDTGMTVPADSTQPIWIRVYVPRGTAPGRYAGAVSVHTNQGTQTVPISVRVADVTIPDAADSSFTTDLWMLQYGSLSWDEGAGDTIELFYGYRRLSPKWWTLMGEFAESMRQYRHNNLPVNVVQLLIGGGSSLAADGTYSFDWSLFDKFVQFFVGRGVVKSLEGFWMSGPGVHGSPVPQTEIIARSDNGESVRSYAEWDTDAARNFVDQFVPALRDHLVAKGWADQWWMHVWDEPSGAENLEIYKTVASRYRTLWPGVRLSDAVVDWDAGRQLAGTQDFLIPNEWTLDNLEDFYADAGKPVWLYNCNVPTYNYLNRFIDQPVWHQRATMWYAFSRGLSGYLHWAFNNWQYKMDDQEVRGDGWITKPDPEHNKLKATIRLESLRDGLEDRELLEIVGKRNASLAQGIADSLVTRSNRYSRDTGYLARMRALLLSAAADESLSDLAAGRPISTAPQAIQVDLGRQAQLDAVRFDARAAYRVDLSFDGEHWSTVFQGRTDLAGLNARGRYVRVTSDSPPTDLAVSGAWMPQENLAGGRPYTLSAQPVDAYPDSGGEATDGVRAGHYADGRSFGYDVPVDSTKSVDVVVDLGSVQRLGSARVHRYEEFETYLYGPDSVKVSTSKDGESFIQKGKLSTPNGADGLWFDFTFPPTSGRYIKITYTKTYAEQADMLFLDEVEAYAPRDDRINVAAGSPYTKSAAPDDPLYPDSDGAESTDGIVGGGLAGYAYYLSPGQTRTVSITIDLRGPKRISGVQVQKFEDGFHRYEPDAVAVSVRSPGGDYRPVAETAWPTGLWYDLDFDPTVAISVRVDLTKTDGYRADYLFVDEIAVLGGADQPTNLAAGRSYTRSPGWDPAYADSGNESTDGVLAGHYSDGNSWAYYLQVDETRTVDIDFDLGVSADLVLARFQQYYDGEHDYAPDRVTLLTSADGAEFTERATVAEPSERWFDLPLSDLSARYVKVRVAKTEAHFADYIFIDEIEIYAD